MRATIYFRIASVLLVLFAVGHTVGFLTLKPPTDKALAVRDAMSSVTFTVKGTVYSYGRFYRGLGLYVTTFELFSAWIAWVLGAMARRAPKEVLALAVPFVLLELVSTVLAKMYFGKPPMVLSAVVAMVLVVAAFQTRKAAAAA